jgi:cyclophilin family peptidyl-prolyl cis-trans isomerase
MLHVRTVLVVAISFLVLPIPAIAADAPAKRGPQAEAFYKLHGEMNALLADLARLQIEYRTANEDKQATIRQQWDELMAKGRKLQPQLVDAAEKAYAEAPNTDKPVTDFLVKLLANGVQTDDYEPAAEVGKLLMEHGCSQQGVANWAGIAAFAVSDFDAAEKYLAAADKAGYYRSPPKDDKSAQVGAFYLQAVGNYKETWAKEKAVRQAEAEADNLPRVLLKTNKGDIEIELFENQAPNTVANFISLVKKGFYNGLTFHRVLAGFMAQGGDPTGSGSGGPGYSIACECYNRPDYRRHFRGTLSMAHAGRDTGGSQFFLTFVPTPHLDGKHTAFGRVVSGMDVLAKIQRRDPGDTDAPRPDKIIEATVIRKRPHEYVPKKMPE